MRLDVIHCELRGDANRRDGVCEETSLASAWDRKNAGLDEARGIMRGKINPRVGRSSSYYLFMIATAAYQQT